MLHLLHRAVSSSGARLTATLLALIPAGASAGPCSEDVAAELAGRKGLYVQTTEGHWKPHGPTAEAGKVRRFAYVGRLTDDVAGRQGAAVVRLARVRGPDDAEAKSIRLRRPDASPTCGARALRLFGLGILNWSSLDFVGGQRVSLNVFIAHHLADQDVSSVITNYHVDYRSLEDGCVSTQKNAKGRRTAFLAEADGDAERAVPTVARKVLSNWGIAPAAVASTPGTPGASDASAPARGSAAYADKFRIEHQAFGAFGAVETQIHTYPLSGRNMCLSFAPSRGLDAEAGARWSIEVVDLDSPRQRPRRDRYSIQWQ